MHKNYSRDKSVFESLESNLKSREASNLYVYLNERDNLFELVVRIDSVKEYYKLSLISSLNDNNEVVYTVMQGLSGSRDNPNLDAMKDLFLMYFDTGGSTLLHI